MTPRPEAEERGSVTEKTAEVNLPAMTPAHELIGVGCWVPGCGVVASFRDGAGWWWCMEHEDHKGKFGIVERQTLASIQAKALEALTAARKQGFDSGKEAAAKMADDYREDAVATAIRSIPNPYKGREGA